MKEHQLKFLKVKIMPRCTVDADFLKSVLEDAKAAGRWADASYRLFLKKGEIPEHAMRRIQQDECILNMKQNSTSSKMLSTLSLIAAPIIKAHCLSEQDQRPPDDHAGQAFFCPHPLFFPGHSPEVKIFLQNLKIVCAVGPA